MLTGTSDPKTLLRQVATAGGKGAIRAGQSELQRRLAPKKTAPKKTAAKKTDATLEAAKPKSVLPLVLGAGGALGVMYLLFRRRS